jgi:hypothetical protein
MLEVGTNRHLSQAASLTRADPVPLVWPEARKVVTPAISVGHVYAQHSSLTVSGATA